MSAFVVPGKRSQTVHHKRLEGTPVYLNEGQRSGAGDNDLNVAEGRKIAGMDVLLARGDRLNERIFSTSVAVGGAKRKKRSIRPGFVDCPGHHGVCE
jgi:hypothetical protein